MALTVCGLVDEAVAAYRWLADRQLPDGSWFNYYQGDGVKDPRLDTNVCAYLAAGALAPPPGHRRRGVSRGALAEHGEGHRLHPALAAARRLGPLVARLGRPARGLRAVDRLVVDLPLPAVRGGGRRVPRPRTVPTGSWRPGGSAMPWRTIPAAFAPKDEFAMDWYYPMLSGALEGEPGRRRIAEGWSTVRARGPGGALRLDRRLGDGGRDGRMRAHARRPRHGRPRPGALRRRPGPPARRRLVLDRHGLPRRARPSRPASAPRTPSPPWCWPPTRSPTPRPRPACSAASACRPRSTWPSRTAAMPPRAAPQRAEGAARRSVARAASGRRARPGAAPAGCRMRLVIDELARVQRGQVELVGRAAPVGRVGEHVVDGEPARRRRHAGPSPGSRPRPGPRRARRR